MSDYDYIISVDENGQPYLAHALFGRGGGNKGSQKDNHKYYTRVEEKGKWRYFYSPEEYKTWASGAVNKAKGAASNAASAVGRTAKGAVDSVKDKLGFDERDRLRNSNVFNRKMRQNAYNNTVLGKAEQAADRVKSVLGNARNAAGNAASAVGNKTRSVVDAAKDKLGFDERERLENSNIFNRNMRQQAYDNTILGKADKATKSAKKKVSNLSDAVKEYGSQKLSDLRGAAGKAKDAVGDKARGAVDAAKDKLGFDERERLENSNIFNRNMRQQAYDNTVLGKAEKAVGKAKDAAGRVKDKADDAADRVKDKAKDVADSARETWREAYGENASDRAMNATREWSNNNNPLKNNKLREEFSDAWKEYRNTPKYNAQSVAEDIDALRDDLRDLARTAGSAAGKVARDTADKVSSKARDTIGEVTGENAKKEMDATGRAALMGLDDAIGSFVDASARYENSLGGKAAAAKSNAEASMKAAQSGAKKALAKAMDYLPDEQIEKIKDLIRGK